MRSSDRPVLQAWRRRQDVRVGANGKDFFPPGIGGVVRDYGNDGCAGIPGDLRCGLQQSLLAPGGDIQLDALGGQCLRAAFAEACAAADVFASVLPPMRRAALVLRAACSGLRATVP